MSARVTLLAAGRSFRMAPISDKNFTKFLGKPLIQHQIEALISSGFHEILIIGGKHNIEALKELRRNIRVGGAKRNIEVVEQKNLDLGMAGAILTAKRVWQKDKSMLLVSSNDVVESSLFQKMFRLSEKMPKNLEGVLVAKKVESYFPGGYIVTNQKGFTKKIVEKPGEGREPSDLVNLVIHLHFRPEVLFQYVEEVSSSKDDRYEIALQNWISDGARFRAEPYKGYWQAVKYPWHILSLMNDSLSKLKQKRGRGVSIAKSAKVSGNVFLEEGVKIMDHAVINGPSYIGKNTVIGTGCLIRGSHIGARCVIGYNSEVARSYVGDGCWFHTNYVGDSVIGDNVAFGSGTVTGNLRLDEDTVKVNIEKTWGGKKKAEKVDTGLKKLGAIIGDNVHVGINTSLMPGVKIGSGSFVGAGITVGEDIPEGSFVRGDFTLKISKNRRKIGLQTSI